MSHSTIYIGNTHVVRLDKLRDELGFYINDAAVTLESLVDKQDNSAVSGLSVPVTMPYVSASDGRYELVLSHGVGIVAEHWYLADLLAVTTSGQRGRWTEQVFATARRA